MRRGNNREPILPRGNQIKRASRFAPRNQAIWVGSCNDMGRFTPKNSVGIGNSKDWWRKSSPNSFAISIQSESAAGSPRRAAKGLVAFFLWNRRQTAFVTRRERGSRLRNRAQPDRRVHSFCSKGWLFKDYALDESRTRGSATPLRGVRFQIGKLFETAACLPRLQ